MANPAAIVRGDGKIYWRENPIPEPGPGQVLLTMKSVGICGSDVKYNKYGRCGSFLLEGRDMVIGHEASGIVNKLGEGVTNLKIGDRVAIEPGVPCGNCSVCNVGRYNLCPDMKFCATPPIDGNLCNYYLHDAKFCFKLPDNVSFDAGALVEPLSVAVHACENRAQMKAGDQVFISGAGPVGLLLMMVCKANGAKKVVMTDMSEHRLQVASSLGADHVLNITGLNPDQAAKQVRELLGTPPDSSYECAGAEAASTTCLKATKSGGCVVLIGMGAVEPKFPCADFGQREVDIKGVFRYANCYPRAIEILSEGHIAVDALITHHFSLEQSQEAFDTASTLESNSIKVMIHCNPEK